MEFTTPIESEVQTTSRPAVQVSSKIAYAWKAVIAAVVCLTRRARSELVHVARKRYPLAMNRMAIAWGDESGSVAEKVVIVAIFVALAIAAGGIIYDKVIAKATSINLG